MVRPDPRTEPREFAQFVADEYKRLSNMYRTGSVSEAVYRASLYALGWRGTDICTECRLNAPDQCNEQPPKYQVVGGVVVLNQ